MKKILLVLASATVIGIIIKLSAAKQLTLFELMGVFIKEHEGKYKLFVRALVDNPTNQSITINTINLGFFYTGKQIGSTAFDKKIIFIPNQKTEIAIPVKVEFLTLIGLIKNWYKNISTDLLVKGTVNMGGFNLPMEKILKLV